MKTESAGLTGRSIKWLLLVLLASLALACRMPTTSYAASPRHSHRMALTHATPVAQQRVGQRGVLPFDASLRAASSSAGPTRRDAVYTYYTVVGRVSPIHRPGRAPPTI